MVAIAQTALLEACPDEPRASVDRPAPRAAATVAFPLNFDEVYDAHVDFVWHSARRLGVCPESLEDVVQDVFIVVHRQLGRFRGEASLRTWLYAITFHVVRNHRRRLRRKPMDLSESAVIALENQPASSRELPDARVESKRAAETLERVLDELPPPLREVLIMAEIQGLTGKQIAAIIGVKPATAHGRLRTARAKFNEAVRRFHARTGGGAHR